MRFQSHVYPRRTTVIFGIPGAGGKAPAGVLDIKSVHGRELLDIGKPPDPFAMLYIHATPGHMRRSTTVVRNMERPNPHIVGFYS
jgi:hypothetical protein